MTDRIRYAFEWIWSWAWGQVFRATPASWLLRDHNSSRLRRFVDYAIGESVLVAYRIDFDEWLEIKAARQAGRDQDSDT